MDPTQTLAEMVDAAEEVLHRFDDPGDSEDAHHDAMDGLAGDMAERIIALDNWIRGGGFLPRQWQRFPPSPKVKTRDNKEEGRDS